MGDYVISKRTVDCETQKLLGFAQSYEQFEAQFLDVSQSGLAAFLDILGEAAGVVRNLGFILGKIPGAPSATVPPIGNLIPVEDIIIPIIDSMAQVVAPAAASAGSFAPALSSVGSALNNYTSAVCGQTCNAVGLSSATGELKSSLDNLRALLNSAQAQLSSQQSSLAARMAKMSFSIPQPAVLSVSEPPPPPIDMAQFDDFMNKVYSILLIIQSILDSLVLGIDTQVTSINQQMTQIKNLVRDLYEMMLLFKLLVKIPKKSIWTVSKILARLERALKAIVLSIFVFFLPTPWAAQMAAFFGIIGEAMGVIEGLLNQALNFLVNSEGAADAAGQAKTQFELQIDGIMDAISGHKTCFSGETLVTMLDGSVKRIENVCIGDFVLTHDGTMSRVVNKFERFVDEEIFMLKFGTSSKDTLVTMEHPFLTIGANDAKEVAAWVLNRDSRYVSRVEKLKRGYSCRRIGKQGVKRRSDIVLDDFKWNSVRNIVEGDVLFVPTPKFPVVDVKLEEFTPSLVGLLGWFAAEGFLIKKSGIAFCLSRKEWGNVAPVLKAAVDGSIFGGNKYTYSVHKNGENSVRIYFGLPKLAAFCREHVGHGAKNKRLSYEMMSVLANDVNLAKTFFKNFIDGDGHHDSYGYKKFGVASLNLREQLYWILLAHGILGRRYFETNRGGPSFRERRFDLFGLRIPKNETLSWWGGVAAQKSRNFDVWKIASSQAVELKKKSAVNFRGLVYNLEIEGNNSYIANGVAVHNCEVRQSISVIPPSVPIP